MSSLPPTSPRMPLVAALEALVAVRTDQIVITSMGAAREWPRLSDHPLDFHYVPSAMGQAASFGLGLALAQPERKLIVLSGDGSLLMNLGCVATIVASKVENLTLIVLDNGCYEVTGGQKTVGAVARVDFAGLASAAGWANVASFDDLIDWQAGVAEILKLPGPRFISLAVERVETDYALMAPGPMAERLSAFRAALSRNPA